MRTYVTLMILRDRLFTALIQNTHIADTSSSSSSGASGRTSNSTRGYELDFGPHARGVFGFVNRYVVVCA
jgi:hypothetical protein